MTKDKKLCSCGRSPTGYCVGWHKLTESEVIKKLQDYITMLEKKQINK